MKAVTWRSWIRPVLSGLLVLSLLTPVRARADQTRAFINSCVYGTLAGTLVGLASLAFTTNPGDNLQNISRGASLGLYAGILLGIYAISSVPGDPSPAGQQAPAATRNDFNFQEDAKLEQPTVAVIPSLAPVVSLERGVEGMQMGLTLSF